VTRGSLIEDYTEIFYVIDKGDIPSIQYKKITRGPKSMRKVYGLCLIFIDFHVSALTPHLNSTETSLQLSEHNPFCGLWHIYTGVISKVTPGVWGASFMQSVQCGGTGLKLVAPLLVYPLA
jgi:hypothetical protein